MSRVSEAPFSCFRDLREDRGRVSGRARESSGELGRARECRTGGRLGAHVHLHFRPGRSEEDRIRNEYEESQWTGDRDTRSSMVSKGGPAASSSAQANHCHLLEPASQGK